MWSYIPSFVELLTLLHNKETSLWKRTKNEEESAQGLK